MCMSGGGRGQGPGGGACWVGVVGGGVVTGWTVVKGSKIREVVPGFN